MIDCPGCDGTGDCQSCNGEDEHCDMCGGVGECPECDGAGEVEDDDQESDCTGIGCAHCATGTH